MRSCRATALEKQLKQLMVVFGQYDVVVSYDALFIMLVGDCFPGLLIGITPPDSICGIWQEINRLEWYGVGGCV